MDSLFEIELDIDKEYLPMINDLVRMGVIQLVAQFLFSITTSEKFFSQIFLQTLFYLLIGIGVYWLIMRKIIIFT